MASYRTLIKTAASRLNQAGIEEARLEAQVLLALASNQTRSQVLARLPDPVNAEVEQQLRHLVGRRLNREPLAYIAGRREFAGHEFLVSPAVLIPRPESELIVEHARAWLEEKGETLLIDVGTGSGALGLTLLLECSATTLLATEISKPALLVAVENARRLGVFGRADFVLGDLTSMLRPPGERTLVVANLPYVAASDREDLQPEVRDWEPPLALFSGPDGLSQIKRLLSDLPRLVRRGDRAYLEIGAGQAAAVVAMVDEHGASSVQTLTDPRPIESGRQHRVVVIDF